jgi:MSHA biogenesis protein MshN
MSLINDVLKDLERRQAPDRPDRPVVECPSGIQHRTFRPWWLLAAISAGVLLYWGMGVQSPSENDGGLVIHAGFEEDRPRIALPPSPLPPRSDRTESAETVAPTAEMPEPRLHAGAEPSEGESPARTTKVETETSLDESPKGQPASAAPAPAVTVAAATRPAPESKERRSSTLNIQRAGQREEQAGIDSARRAMARGHHQRAESLLRDLLEQDPANDEARELLALQLLERGQREAAIQKLEAGLDTAADPGRLGRRLGRLLLDLDQPQRAVAILSDHATATPSEPDHLQLLAAAHRQAGDHAAAEATYRQLATLVPDRAAAWIGLAASLEALQQPEDARQAYARVLEGNDPQAVRFARQRLRAIEAEHGDPQ